MEDATTLIVAVTSAVAAAAGPIAAGHALLTKREPQVAGAWIAVCLVFPLAGAVIYYVFGINRVRTRARKLVAEERIPPSAGPSTELHSPTISPEYAEQVRISDAVTGRKLETGNRLQVLHNGEQAYPAMLNAIDAAERTVFLSSYIFENNASGRQFIRALAAAYKRGVDVRVLIDGVGELYSWPRASTLLKRSQVPVARFLPPRIIPPQLSINLRNHRKMLIIDGRLAFTGGMNIGDRHLVQSQRQHRVADMHFSFDGPVARQIEEVFLEDWEFTTGISDYPPSHALRHTDGALCRVISDGPNEDLDRLVMTLIGALSAAREEVWLVSPYFLPMRSLVTALEAAALRGVTVRVLLPEQNNLPFVHWATRHMLGELIHWGVKVYYQPPPFAHTKLFVVDRRYAQVGSANLDPRSLRLNFELNAEIYNRPLAQQLAADCERICARSRSITEAELNQRRALERVRDAIFWLTSPYL
ncbi:cardiolipin synthase [Halorhodospira halochloris]|uniref:Cardiolipin synthase n=1 Tax=Halorhodospira halochloris TaxID=1052 RepID=A0A0X8X6F8_HALHR|nr:cardiolipin synthase [Halorhodospira halochloris]MBK1651035.1 cardiolipin synthase [Halorhodospira halochloris]MCG5529395.1 cardiolipin synthase [Halorhodospira halochloris]MCG5547378.1 cardiolipin synthase [Halorhodospira halochloris]BAU56451.1 cardiolipin synthetase [Halorhodospira halochloris]